MAQEKFAPRLVDKRSIGLHVESNREIRRAVLFGRFGNNRDRLIIVGWLQKKRLTRVPAHHDTVADMTASKYIGKKIADRFDRERKLGSAALFAKIAITTIQVTASGALQNHHLNRLYRGIDQGRPC